MNAVEHQPVSFSVGDRVYHAKFGDGTVTGIDGAGMVVAFDRAGTRRIIGTYLTPLTEKSVQPASDNRLVLCHCGSGRKRGSWKPYCAVCERKQVTRSAAGTGSRGRARAILKTFGGPLLATIRRPTKAGNIWKLSKSLTRSPSAAWWFSVNGGLIRTTPWSSRSKTGSQIRAKQISVLKAACMVRSIACKRMEAVSRGAAASAQPEPVTPARIADKPKDEHRLDLGNMRTMGTA
jgi:hypothetical protein